MEPILIALLIGLLAGLASGAFGIGGATLTAPLMRVFLEAPGHVAVGTPLPLVIPMALSGLYVFHQKKALNLNVIFTAGIVGSIFSIFGAYFTDSFTGSQMMLFIALLMLLSAVLLFSKVDPKSGRTKSDDFIRIGSIGGLAGFISGFLGVGGGGFLVPLFMVVLGLRIHEAIACSLGTILIYSIPGSVTHFMLNHIDMTYLVPLLVFGVIGAQLGSRYVVKQDSRKTKTFMAIFYVILALILVLNEHIIPGI